MGFSVQQLGNTVREWIGGLATLPTDTPAEKRRKVSLTMAALMVCLAGVVWSGMYAWLGLTISALIPITYSIVVGLSLGYFFISKRLGQFLVTQLALILWLPFLLQWSLGGFAASGVVMFWAILAPVGALMFQGVRHSLLWLAAYIGLTLYSIWLDPYLIQNTPPVSLWVRNLFFGMNLITVSSITFTVLHYFVSSLKQEISNHQQTEALLVEANQTLTQTVSELQRVNSQLEAEIVERKQTEAALQQAKQIAEISSQAKDTLLAKVSHELRTPLGAILGYAQLIRDGFYGPLTQDQREALAEITDSTDYLTIMVKELLEQAQMSAGKLTLTRELFEPRALLDQVQVRMRVLAQKKDLTLSTHIAPEIPATLYGHPTQIQQILINLVGNAIKFTQQGEVQVYLCKPNETYWQIQVRDTGAGIPKQAQAQIFEPFGQVDDSLTREHSGTGLGLAIVKQLITLMQGKITLESEVGQGSAFTVLLPLISVPDNTEPTTSDSP